jgi:hypothetical protein
VPHPTDKDINILLFPTKTQDDLFSTYHNYTKLEETDQDPRVKETVMELTEMTDGDVEWITVPDPYLEDPARYEEDEDD